MASIGCTGPRLTLAVLVPGPLPKTSSNSDRPNAATSGRYRRRSSDVLRKSTSEQATAATSPSSTPSTKRTNSGVSRSGSARDRSAANPSAVSSSAAESSSTSPRPRVSRHTSPTAAKPAK